MSELEKYGPLAGIIASGQLIKEIYTDLASPAIKVFGITLKEVIEIGVNNITYPVRLFNEKQKLRFAIHLKNYEEELKKINSDKYTSVPPEIAQPILENLINTTNDDLSRAFINLLVSASNSNTAQFAHPSFIRIIESLSSDEAKLIKHTYEHEKIRTLSILSFSDFHQNDDKYKDLFDLGLKSWFLSGPLSFLTFPENINIYINNLTRLGVLDFTDMEKSTDESFKSMIRAYEDKYPPSQWHELLSTGYNYLYERRDTKAGFVHLTHYGLLFAKICMKP